MQTAIQYPIVQSDFPEADFHKFWKANALAGRYNHYCEYSYQMGWGFYFYKLKTVILKKYGKRVGTHLQTYNITCRSCGGTGTHEKYSYETGDVYRVDTCWYCNKGIYDVRYVLLDVWVLAGASFHIPNRRVEDVDELKRIKSNPDLIGEITGKVRHNANITPGAALQCFLELAYKYNRSVWSNYYVREILSRQLKDSLREGKITLKANKENQAKREWSITRYQEENELLSRRIAECRLNRDSAAQIRLGNAYIEEEGHFNELPF